MRLPPLSGVYVVEMLNDEPISVNADRLKIADSCIRVTRSNCKYGQAKNLARRQLDYEKTFGPENVRFRYFAVTPHYAAVEAIVGARLVNHRIPGTTGRLNEWLQGVSAEAVESLVREVLASLPAEKGVPRQPSSQQEDHRSRSRAPDGISPAALVAAARYLRQRGMTVDLLRDMHHSPRRDETFTSTLRYFGGKSDIKDNNIRYGARLIYVAQEHQATGRSFEEIVSEALQRHPTYA